MRLKKLHIALIIIVVALLAFAAIFGYAWSKSPKKVATEFVSTFYTSDEVCYMQYQKDLKKELDLFAASSKENANNEVSSIAQYVYDGYNQKFAPLVDEPCLENIWQNSLLPAIDEYASLNKVIVNPSKVEITSVSKTTRQTDKALLHTFEFNVEFKNLPNISNAKGTLSITNNKVTSFKVIINPFLQK